MRAIKGREIEAAGYEQLKNVSDKYIKVQGIDARLVNIPTISTGINDDGTITQQVIDPYAYEVMDQSKTVID